MAKSNSNNLVARLAAVTVLMFGFGFALVPLYDVFCDITGLNGKTNTEAYVPASEVVDQSRQVRVQFIAHNSQGMPWDFKPDVFELLVHPGEQIHTTFFAHNPLQKAMVAQAIPSVAPGRAAAYFHKTECFCFNQQALEGGQSIDMPLTFVVDRELPSSVTTITLSYTLFDVTNGVSQSGIASL
jgi:cytochrome c oxidase assembly protein subunit 11